MRPARVQGLNASERIYLGAGAVLRSVAPSRARKEPEAVLEGARPQAWVADLGGSQQGHGEQRQVCLAHRLRDVQYALDAADEVCAPAKLAWLKRSIQVGQKRELVKDATPRGHRWDSKRRLKAVLKLAPQPDQR